ncbi:ABC transporter permease [Halomonas sp. GD1P12]|uniref:ABC transporter permease n=1 Tax=Halomonas sp. GD1P12 TaxID=2982691 RepID=UPI0021E460C3|nr:ABC transporter permease subunit [Halomonas sp. GD1P12]UYG00627.1 ABC transporter permease subunit [Halomonas sp. GD1P12]
MRSSPLDRLLPRLRAWQGLAPVAPSALGYSLFFLLPLALLILTALESPLATGARLLAEGLVAKSLLTSVLLSVTTAFLSVLVGVVIAEYLHHQSPRQRFFLLWLISLPLIFSGLIVAYGFILLLGRAGFVTLSLASLGVDPAWFGRFVYTPQGLVFVYAYFLIPRVVLLMLPVVQGLDRRQLVMAQSFGASSFQRIRDVYLPALAPAMVSSWSLCAAVAFGAYGTALALTGSQINLLPLLLYSNISDAGSDMGSVALLALVMMCGCLLLTLPGEWVRRRGQRRIR